MDALVELQESSDYLKERGIEEVDVAIVLGTGLGGLVESIDVKYSWSYSQIPHLPVATVEQHFGKLIYGLLEGKKVLAWQGRFHFYEGYSMEQVVKPVRISRMLGAKALLISNASGLHSSVKTLTAAQGIPMCTAAITSGTVDITTASAPIVFK